MSQRLSTMQFGYTLTPFGIAALSAVIGSFITLLWEGAIKPVRLARSTAEVLSIEISRNGQGLVADQVQRRADPASVPPRSPMHTELYQVVLAQLGEIPRPLLGQLVHLYGLFGLVNELSIRANDLRDRMVFARTEQEISPQIADELNLTLGVYMNATQKAIDMIIEVQFKVVALAFPWWSSRRWFGPRHRLFTEQEMAGKFSAYETDVKRSVAEVERARKGSGVSRIS
jgi:hypothetical protein